MTDPILDLSQCAREPVHTPGSVQPHSSFVAIDIPSLTICAASESFCALVGWPPHGPTTGTTVSEVFESASSEKLMILAEGARVPRPHLLILKNGRHLNALGYLWEGLLMLDIEPVVEGEIERLDAATLEAEAAMRLISATSDMKELSRALVQTVARVTGFDRVMLYEFDRDWNGSVQAEACGPAALESFLGLKFPASDIPSQARALFLRNRVRQIVDVNAAPSPIRPDRHPALGGPLDLSDSQVRAVSPVHLHYLRNMGVRASLVIALVRDEKLYGLLSCQHIQGPRYLPIRVRALCGLLGEAFSAQVRRHEGLQIAARRRQITESLEPLSARAMAVAKASEGAGFATFMTGVEAILLDLAAVDTLWLSTGDQAVLLGRPIEAARLAELVDAAEAQGRAEAGEVTFSDSLADIGLTWRHESAGFAYARIRDDQGIALAIRGEQRRFETWAGDPDKRAIVSADGLRLDPRSSFETWTKERLGCSLPWSDGDLLAVRLIAERLPRWRLAFAQAAREALITRLEASRAETRRLALVAERTGDAVIITDAEGRTQWVNPGFTRLSGCTLDDLRRRKPGEILQGPLTSALEVQRMGDAIRKGESVRSLVVNYTRGGVPYWIDIEITPVLDEEGAIRQFISVARDATAAQAQSEALMAARETAERASATKSQFLASISHEIRTPMAGVIGLADLLAERVRPPDLKDMARTIHQTGASLIVILNDLLDLAKIEAGHLDLETAPFSPGDLLNHVQALYRASAEKKGLLLEIVLDQRSMQRRLGDRHRILQVLSNLVSNSLRFTEAGSVSVAVRCDQPDILTFVVSDEGCGMTEAQAANVFHPFRQAEISTARLHGGTGLGLSIVSHLVQLMGGRIELETAHEAGTMVTVYIPAPEAEASPALHAVPDIPVLDLPAGLQVLAADDVAVNRMLLKVYLDKLGVEARIAESGDQALELARQRQPNLLLLDIVMPGKSGLDTLAEIRAMEIEEGRIPAPAVAVTVDVMRQDVEAYHAAGFVAHVAKPLDAASLKAAMLGALRATAD